MVDESQQGKGTGQAAADSGKRVADLERRERVIKELGNHLERSKAHRGRFRAGALLRIAVPLTALNLILVAASWVSISSAIQATNRATAQLIKDIDKGNEEQTQTLLTGVKETNRRLTEQIATFTKIQENEAKAGAERQKLLESLERLLVSTGQQVEDVKKNTEDTAKHAETLASQKPKVVTKTVTKTRTKTVRPPTLYEKIFGTRKPSR